MFKVLSLIFPILLFGVPSQIIFVPHAETAEQAGILSLKGKERAAAFVPYFLGAPEVNTHPLPSAIFACCKSGAETITPLSAELHLAIQSIKPAEIAKIVSNPDYEGSTLLICGSEERLPQFLEGIKIKNPPKKWKKDRHDLLWIVEFEDEGNPSLKEICQKLLYGDHKNP
jgi:hypothetical protein